MSKVCRRTFADKRAPLPMLHNNKDWHLIIEVEVRNSLKKIETGKT